MTRRDALRGVFGGIAAAAVPAVAVAGSEAARPVPYIRCILGEHHGDGGYDLHPIDDDGELLPAHGAFDVMHALSPQGWRFQATYDGPSFFGQIVRAYPLSVCPATGPITFHAPCHPCGLGAPPRG